MLDAISPTGLYRDVVWGITVLATQIGLMDRPFDPFEGIIKVVSGDWAGLRACADVYTNIGLAVGDMAVNVQWSAQQLDEFWKGNAADSAQTYLYELAKSLKSAQAPFQELADHYVRAADGAHEVGELLGALMCDLIDAGLAFMAGLEAAGASAATVVGAPAAVVIAEATLMYELVKIVEIIYTASKAVDLGYEYMQALEAGMSGLGIVLVPDNMPRLDPSGPRSLPR
ncbi:hypothetical protein [Amycolatopsis sp. YIM 10]|uniref:hypothetical protein n=1 Tax=Amycolatopsis sp. YIM 10 TaxID=2653857 RepID=UPI0012907945|nr:hypothetical protein [Amycolatopsis sp. YIM 10]QFU88289.1 hypothetical protein YIM_15540 [Amycolatopsis sp. YIM 10]